MSRHPIRHLRSACISFSIVLTLALPVVVGAFYHPTPPPKPGRQWNLSTWTGTDTTLCAQDGYRVLYRQDGTAFPNADACVTYVTVQHGTYALLEVVTAWDPVLTYPFLYTYITMAGMKANSQSIHSVGTFAQFYNYTDRRGTGQFIDGSNVQSACPGTVQMTVKATTAKGKSFTVLAAVACP